VAITSTNDTTFVGGYGEGNITITSINFIYIYVVFVSLLLFLFVFDKMSTLEVTIYHSLCLLGTMYVVTRGLSLVIWQNHGLLAPLL
jgi:hypothetical protein